MIVTETITIREKEYKHTCSKLPDDKGEYTLTGYYIRKVGTDEVYADAIDDINSDFEYVETDEKIPDEPEPESEVQTNGA